tara:strand:- start:79075 stop:79818 length:744 start_codon:yes stop_codon:yes gene_type:complete
MIFANWKANGSKKEINHWVETVNARINKTTQSKIAFSPPSCYLSFSKDKIVSINSEIKLASQNFDYLDNGSVTGALDIEMICDLNCNYSLLGHSERRILWNESEELLKKKILKISEKAVGLVYCIGETLEEKSSKKTKSILMRQLENLQDYPDERLFVAYEPVWAIGTGNIPSIEYIDSIHRMVKEELKSSLGNEIKVIYGGSVTEKNVDDLSNSSFIDGLLVGGASLNAENFAKICNNFALKKWKV